MQWCDPDTFEWLTCLLISPAAAGVLVLGTVRTEKTGREHPFTRFIAWVSQSGMAVEIPLEPLNEEETAELARLESPKPVDSERLSDIVRATRGNPLFVVESVRAGLQSTRVHAVIAARLGQLTAASYELAGLASVIGRPFSFELLENAMDWDETAFPAHLTNCGSGASLRAEASPSTISRTTACAKSPAMNLPWFGGVISIDASLGLWPKYMQPISKPGMGRLAHISNRPEWRKRRLNITAARQRMRIGDMQIRKPRTC